MADLDWNRLVEKLRAIEALHARPGSDGERAAAENARERILQRLREVEEWDPPVEYQFSMPDMWSRRVFVALLRRYGINPYRYPRQRYTTVMAKVSKRFVDETLWPEYQAFASNLRSYLDEMTERVVAVIHADTSEATVREEGAQLSLEAAAEAAPAPPAAPAPAAAASPPTSSPSDVARRDRNKRKKRKKRKRR